MGESDKDHTGVFGQTSLSNSWMSTQWFFPLEKSKLMAINVVQFWECNIECDDIYYDIPT